MKITDILRYGVYFGLAVSISLATGYLAGRLHVEAYTSEYGEPTAALQDGNPLLPDNSRSQSRTGLNPKPIRPKTPSGTQSDTRAISRHPASKAMVPSLTDNDEEAGPRHIGEFADPEEPYQEVEVKPKHIGTFSDPDAIWPANESSLPVAIGEFKDPDW